LVLAAAWALSGVAISTASGGAPALAALATAGVMVVLVALRDRRHAARPGD
jgi:hypothetical protein